MKCICEHKLCEEGGDLHNRLGIVVKVNKYCEIHGRKRYEGCVAS